MAARTPPLRAVQAGEKKPRVRRKPPTVIEAAESGDHRQLLIAMRERIARAVSDPECPPRDLAALTRRLQDVSKEIEVLDARAEQEAGEDDVAPDEAFDAEAL